VAPETEPISAAAEGAGRGATTPLEIWGRVERPTARPPAAGQALGAVDMLQGEAAVVARGAEALPEAAGAAGEASAAGAVDGDPISD
jgi:hypothetical protein